MALSARPLSETRRRPRPMGGKDHTGNLPVSSRTPRNTSRTTRHRLRRRQTDGGTCRQFPLAKSTPPTTPLPPDVWWRVLFWVHDTPTLLSLRRSSKLLRAFVDDAGPDLWQRTSFPAEYVTPRLRATRIQSKVPATHDRDKNEMPSTRIPVAADTKLQKPSLGYASSALSIEAPLGKAMLMEAASLGHVVADLILSVLHDRYPLAAVSLPAAAAKAVLDASTCTCAPPAVPCAPARSYNGQSSTSFVDWSEHNHTELDHIANTLSCCGLGSLSPPTESGGVPRSRPTWVAVHALRDGAPPLSAGHIVGLVHVRTVVQPLHKSCNCIYGDVATENAGSLGESEPAAEETSLCVDRRLWLKNPVRCAAAALGEGPGWVCSSHLAEVIVRNANSCPVSPGIHPTRL